MDFENDHQKNGISDLQYKRILITIDDDWTDKEKIRIVLKPRTEARHGRVQRRVYRVGCAQRKRQDLGGESTARRRRRKGKGRTRLMAKGSRGLAR